MLVSVTGTVNWMAVFSCVLRMGAVGSLGLIVKCEVARAAERCREERRIGDRIGCSRTLKLVLFVSLSLSVAVTPMFAVPVKPAGTKICSTASLVSVTIVALLIVIGLRQAVFRRKIGVGRDRRVHDVVQNVKAARYLPEDRVLVVALRLVRTGLVRVDDEELRVARCHGRCWPWPPGPGCCQT